MTKFILHGGSNKESLETMRSFFNEILDGYDLKLASSIAVLIVCFARYEKDWVSTFEKYKNRYRVLFNNLSFDFVLADGDRKKFIEQIKNSRIIHFCGGGEPSIKKYIKKAEDINPYLSDKIVVGTSAGANIFSRYYYSNDRGKIEKGLGLLPLKIISHYSTEKKDSLIKLQKFGRDKSLITCPIKEDQFVVFCN